MANTSARMLRLLSLLQTHRYWPGNDLAERLDVSPRTLRRDVDRLRELGYPVEAARGVSGGYQLQVGAVLPPLLLDDDEAVAIAVGLRAAAAGIVGGIEETSVRALAKLVQVMPPRLRRRVDALRTYTVPAILDAPLIDAATITVIAHACRDDERLRFSYTRRDGNEGIRLVEPHRLVTLGRRWYLLAWDVERHDWRTFRVDRLTNPTTTGTRFRQRELPGGDPAQYVRDHTSSVPTRYRAEIVVHAPASDVEPAVARWGTVEPIDDRTCRLRMSVHDLADPASMLAALGAEFEVVEPPELRTYLQRIGQLFIKCAAN
jgi:predicted DNA-binding transcriptional regulator YafY